MAQIGIWHLRHWDFMVFNMLRKTSKKLSLAMMGFAIFSFFACIKGKERKSSEEEIVSEQTMDKFTVVQTKKGKEQWKLEANRAEIYEEKGFCVMDNPRVEIYQNGEVVSILTADRGKTYSNTGDIEVEGDVELVSLVDNIKIRTSKLKWIGSKRLIVSDEKVVEEKKDVIITGWGLEATPDLGKILIKKDVKAKVKTH